MRYFAKFFICKHSHTESLPNTNTNTYNVHALIEHYFLCYESQTFTLVVYLLQVLSIKLLQCRDHVVSFCTREQGCWMLPPFRW